MISYEIFDYFYDRLLFFYVYMMPTLIPKTIITIPRKKTFIRVGHNKTTSILLNFLAVLFVDCLSTNCLKPRSFITTGKSD